MNILIIGTGVIGCIYGWQLSESGNKVIHYVRKGKKEGIDHSGIQIQCLDARQHGKPWINVNYCPIVTEEINYKNCNFDLIIVPVKANQLDTILPLLSKIKDQVTILFLQNLWVTHIQQIQRALPDSRVILGQAHITGGGKKGNTISCTIFGNNNAPTMLGLANGGLSSELIEVNTVMKEANLNPQISQTIVDWLLSHYAEANGLVAGVLEAGSAIRFVSNDEYIRHSINLVREGFRVCSRLGIHLWKVYPQVLYYSPMWLLSPILRKMYSSEETQLMIQGHISHSPDEMRSMFYDVFNTGKSLGLGMPNYEKANKYMENIGF